MKIINKCLSLKELEEYIDKKEITRKVDKIILHHTSDTLINWKKGKDSCVLYKKAYEKKAWTSGPHFFVAPEGIWLFTDINIQGQHANMGNKASIGIEMVGNYDKYLPKNKIWKQTKELISILLEKYNLKKKDIHFHREYNKEKTCPGKAITKKWVSDNI
jgi:hypothetical protein